VFCASTGSDGIRITATRNAALQLYGSDTSIQAGETSGFIQWITADTNNPGVHGQINVTATNTAGSGEMQLWSGTAPSIVKNIVLRGDTAVFNEDGANIDFRVESDTNTHAFFVDASTGNVLIKGSDSSVANTGFAYEYASDYIKQTSVSGPCLYLNRRTTDGTIQVFRKDNGSVGSVSVSSSGTTYNTTSDRRLKDNIETITDGTAKVMAMNPVTHTWKADPEAPAVHGFIAQEMQEIVPEAVTGEDGEEEMMSMDYGRITPVIVAALQDAHREIQNLKAEIAALKGDK